MGFKLSSLFHRRKQSKLTHPQILYTFAGSIWGAAAELAVIELGYDNVEKKQVNLMEGENFTADFISLNPLASIPTYEVGDGKTVLTNTTDVIAHLVKEKGGKAAANKNFIATVHEEKIDPNFALLSARSQEELTAKAGSIPGAFVDGRQAALEKYSVLPEGAAHKSFYEEKIASNGGLRAIYKAEVPADDFFQASIKHWENINAFVNDILPKQLPESGFIGGSKPGEVDFHVGAWLARIAAVTGAAKSEEGLEKLQAGLEGPVPPKVAAYWNAWSARQSWKDTYAQALH